MSAQHTTASTDPGGKSAAEVEREVRESRARVERTLDQIQNRLSPGQLVDQAMTYFRDSGGREFARNFGESVKQNPMPVALMAVGVAWMMMSGRRTYDDNGYERSAYWDEDVVGGEPEASPLYPAYEPLYGADRDLGADREVGGHDDHGPGAFDRAQDAARRARDKADDLLGRTRSAAGGTMEGATTRAGALRGRARESVASARRGVRSARARAGSYGRRARHGIVDAFYEHPLVLGSIGLAVGAAIGAALPPTETEDELMGETRDRLKRDAEETGREQLAKARAAAGAAVAAGREEAERQGLSADAAKAGAESVRDKVERVAEAAKDAATERAEQEGLGHRRDVAG
ncbi:MAG TPA: DUF3618 domain-containing protein [Geminicoccaceae bacterium]|nr:DUF3618 domain-containing protein [Geminicoccaceae bacterium]